MRLIVVCLCTSQENFPSHPYPSGSIPTPPPRIRTNREIGESPMVWAASALPQNGHLPAVGSGRGNVGCPMLWQQQPPQIALVNCYVDLPPLDEFDRTEQLGSRP